MRNFKPVFQTWATRSSGCGRWCGPRGWWWPAQQKRSPSAHVQAGTKWQFILHFYIVRKGLKINSILIWHFYILLKTWGSENPKMCTSLIYFWATPFRKKWSDRQIFTSTVFKNAQRCLPAWWRRWLGPSPRLASWCASRDAPRTRWRWRCRRSGSGRRSRAWCIDELWPVWPDLAHFETFWGQIF